MPELPEVETTRRGLSPHLLGRTIDRVVIRERRLRWPIPEDLEQLLEQQVIRDLRRRGKYLLMDTGQGSALWHLGMSGSLRLLPAHQPPDKHDHVDILLDSALCLRYHDPRRFGSLLWAGESPEDHPLLRHLGPEPLDDGFSGDSLHRAARGRAVAVKHLIMDSRVVVGVGNIYANEALFLAGIRPGRPAGKISRPRYRKLAEAIREVLREAIAAGGTTLRDFVDGNGQPGYFSQSLRVYGRAGLACGRCAGTVHLQQLGQRATYFCPRCQR